MLLMRFVALALCQQTPLVNVMNNFTMCFHDFAVQLFVAGCLQGLFNNGAVPLYYELAIENTYPVAEVCNSTIMTFVYNCIPLFFLIIFLIPNVGE